MLHIHIVTYQYAVGQAQSASKECQETLGWVPLANRIVSRRSSQRVCVNPDDPEHDRTRCDGIDSIVGPSCDEPTTGREFHR
jgi:hypothetical protein